eukprot:19293-Heterococcus_DN1.PRE.2
MGGLQQLRAYQRAMSTPSTTKAVGSAGFELSADTVLNGATAAAAAAAAADVVAALFCRLCALEGASRCYCSVAAAYDSNRVVQQQQEQQQISSAEQDTGAADKISHHGVVYPISTPVVAVCRSCSPARCNIARVHTVVFFTLDIQYSSRAKLFHPVIILLQVTLAHTLRHLLERQQEVLYV